MVCPYFIPEEPRIHREQEFFRSLLGDVNGDGYVGFDDLLLVAGALGTVPLAAEARVLDWNLDGQLDVRDLAIVASRLGSRLG